MVDPPRLLWHYTCDHGAEAIQREGLIRPNPHPFLGGLPIAWFTDLDPAHRYEIGLTSDSIACDRTAHRFAVAHPEQVQWWPRFARQQRLPQRVRTDFETGRLPAHWWVSLTPVDVAPEQGGRDD